VVLIDILPSAIVPEISTIPVSLRRSNVCPVEQIAMPF
jgi:hypothetical protein